MDREEDYVSLSRLHFPEFAIDMGEIGGSVQVLERSFCDDVRNTVGFTWLKEIKRVGVVKSGNLLA